jgi:CheY-like chemotaxis protein
MLGRVVGEDVTLKTDLAKDLWNIKVDPGSLEQVIMNLAVNARDAMPMGGTLTVTTRNEALQEPILEGDGQIAAGRYVVIEVKDTGCGMDEETRQQVFEPFFTTKQVGEGTGLGLSTCYGIVSQAGGHIHVDSVPDLGTRFEIRLPATSEDERLEREAPNSTRLHGQETVLVVEDEEQLRRLVSRALGSFGYTVVEAANGQEALELAQNRSEKVDLLLTDVVMPVMGGKELAENLEKLFPKLKVLFMSGYTADAIAHRGVLELGTHLLDKPFTPEVLGQAVRRVLDESNGG